MTPYGSVSGLFRSGDDYQLSNDMKVDGQSYDSMRYELGVDAVIPLPTAKTDQTQHFKLKHVCDDSNNDNDVNGDSIDNGTEGSAVRVGRYSSSASPRTSAPITDANYLGGGDVDQDAGPRTWVLNIPGNILHSEEIGYLI